MRCPLLVAAAQPVIVSHDVAGNARRHAEAVESAGARVVVFPELSLTGYELDAPTVDPLDRRLEPLVRACARAGAIALVGAPVAGGRGDSIGVLAVSGEGASVVYRKIWLGDDEVERFVPGPQPALVEVDGWRLGLAVCKDTGVEQHAAATADLGVDAIVAGVLEHEVDGTVQPDRARRIATKHDVWVVIASCAGSTGGGFDPAAGRSAIFRPDGSTAAEAGPGPGDLARAHLQP